MKLLFRTAAAAAAAVLLMAGAAAAAPAGSARCTAVIDGATGQVLYEHDGSRRSLVASLTKIMTGLLICEGGCLDRTVIVPPEAAGVEGSSLYLKAGERLTAEQLLYGLMLRSGNDAAVALAADAAGSVEAFVAQMNRKASELGLADTHFANPHGLDDDANYSTALDMARLAAAALENETFRQVVSTKTYEFGGRSLKNHNKMLWSYEGAVGVKTGYTRAAGRLLVSAAERMGRRIVVVTVNDPSDWADHTALLDWAFGQLTETELLPAGRPLGAVPLAEGGVAPCRLAEPLTCALRSGETPQVRICLPRFAFGPVKAGEAAGWAEVRLGDAVLARARLVWSAQGGSDGRTVAEAALCPGRGVPAAG